MVEIKPVAFSAKSHAFENEKKLDSSEHQTVELIPRPSNDPRDPLNWSMSRKVKIMGVIGLAVFSGFCSSQTGQLNVRAQSILYGVSTTHITYQYCWVGHRWLLLGSFGVDFMTQPNDYNSFVVSRFFAGIFGSIVGIMGPGIIVDMFFLHQRGRAFTVFQFCLNFGTTGGPTLSAFITSDASWTLEFWWTVGLVGVALILVLFMLYDTAWDREMGRPNISIPESFLANRIATFLPGTKVVRPWSKHQLMRQAALPFLIGASPVTFIIGIFSLSSFGFYVAMNSITPIWLQKPVEAGGYGFTVLQNACFSLVHWVGIGIALIYGHSLSDRLPLAVCARRGGTWKPEYRLHALWIPGLILNPIGLGIFGAALQYKLSWGILALGQLLVTFSSIAISAVVVNYICECFNRHSTEASIAINAYRILLGLTVPFYINPWVAAVSVGWAYGMMAIFDAVTFLCVILLLWKGHSIRGLAFGNLGCSEEGERVVKVQQDGSRIL